MGKVFVAKIENEFEVDENNYLHWEDEYEIDDNEKGEDFKPRSNDELIKIIISELTETISVSVNDYSIRESIVVMEKGEK